MTLEATAATCRALACDTRLAILYHLSSQPELPSSQIAELAGIPQQLASDHLAHLTTLGFLHRRRSGASVYYSLAAPQQGLERCAPVALVRRAFRDSEWSTGGWTQEGTTHLSPRAAATVGLDVARVMDIVFDAATAFGNVRRLLILRLLRQEGAFSTNRIEEELRMSPQACWRHLEKLQRRGYARQEARGRWRLTAEQKTGFHAGLLEWVFSGKDA